VNGNNLFSDSLTETDVRCAIRWATGAISRRKCEWINFNVVHSCRTFTSKNSAKTTVDPPLSSPLARNENYLKLCSTSSYCSTYNDQVAPDPIVNGHYNHYD
jgi:hypothetical protein